MEVEHTVRSSGYTRLFSTHTVTSLTDMQKHNTKHRYDTDSVLFSTAGSGFSARTLAPYIWDTLMVHYKSLIQYFEHGYD